MSDDNRNEDNGIAGYATIRGSGVSTTVHVATLIVAVVISGVAGFFAHNADSLAPEKIAQTQMRKAEAEAQKSQLDYQLAVQKSVAALQQEAAKDCMTRNGTPQYIQGNVTCQK